MACQCHFDDRIQCATMRRQQAKSECRDSISVTGREDCRHRGGLPDTDGLPGGGWHWCAPAANPVTGSAVRCERWTIHPVSHQHFHSILLPLPGLLPSELFAVCNPLCRTWRDGQTAG